MVAPYREVVNNLRWVDDRGRRSWTAVADGPLTDLASRVQYPLAAPSRPRPARSYYWVRL